MARSFLLCLCIFMATPLSAAPVKSKPRPVVGWVEKVMLEDVSITLKARMDTGAGLSSVDAEIVQLIPSEGKGKPERTIFQVKDEHGETKTLERDIVKWINIKKKGADGFIRRPVVRMDFCLGGKKIEGRVNLAERSGFLYPLLIGRNILKTGDFLIDPTRTFTHKPGCGVAKK
ncbi:MAG: RimK/LysX family protein [Rickettsiales bacterium]|nr:RimK/LysX family protein [Rickettsiales bacterium]